MRSGAFLGAAAWLLACGGCGGEDPSVPRGSGGGAGGGGAGGGEPGSFALVDLESAPPGTPYNLVRVRGTHNSYSPREHGGSLGEQLAGGVRMLELDLRLVKEPTHASVKQDGGSDPAIATRGDRVVVGFERGGEVFAWQGERLGGAGIDWRARSSVGAGARPALAYAGDGALVVALERGGKVETTRAATEGARLAFSGAFEVVGPGASPALAIEGKRAALVLEHGGELVLRLGEVGEAGITWCPPASLGPGAAPALDLEEARLAVAYAEGAEVGLFRGELGSGCEAPALEGSMLGPGTEPALAIGPSGVVVVASSAGALRVFRETSPGGALEAAPAPPDAAGVSPALAGGADGLVLVHRLPESPRLFTWADLGTGWEGEGGERVRVAHDGDYDKDPEIGYERGLGGAPVFGPAYLEDYAAHVRAFRELEPDHTPLALLLDVKEKELLPRLGAVVESLEQAIGEGVLLAPSEVQGAHPSMREAIASGWPAISALSGRILLVFSGLASREDHPLAFKEVTRFPECLAETDPGCADTALFARPAAVEADEAVLDLLRRGHVVRYWSVVDETEKAEARRIGVQWVAEDGFGL